MRSLNWLKQLHKKITPKLMWRKLNHLKIKPKKLIYIANKVNNFKTLLYKNNLNS